MRLFSHPIHYNNISSFHYIHSHASEFKTVNRFRITNLLIDIESIELIKKLLPQLEYLQLDFCSDNGDIYELILKNCENLKQLYVESFSRDWNWLPHEYPKLEHLLLFPHSIRLEELSSFFALNPNIQRFSTGASFFWEHSDIFRDSNIKLDMLELKEDGFLRDGFPSVMEFLNQLYEREFYKRLFISIEHLHDIAILASAKGLESLCIRELRENDDLSPLKNLKELVLCGSNTVDMENLAKHLMKLQRLHIKDSIFDDITPFIRQSRILHKIKVSGDSSLVLNLTMLNEERSTLDGAWKITIYVDDDVFLNTKWMTKNGDTDLEFIEMRRSNSYYDWNMKYTLVSYGFAYP